MSIALRHHRPGRPSVRLLILGWSLWLLALWGMLWLQMSVNHASVRWLVFGAALGLFVAWPALRLSQWGSTGGVLLDWLALNLLWQTVLWPLMTIARWPVSQAIWLAVAMAAWSLAVGWLIALGGLWDRGPARTVAMGGCLLMLLGEPLLMLGSGRGPWPTWISPLGSLWALTEAAGYFELQPWANHISLMAAVAVGAWGALLLFRAASVRIKHVT